MCAADLSSPFGRQSMRRGSQLEAGLGCMRNFQASQGFTVRPYLNSEVEGLRAGVVAHTSDSMLCSEAGAGDQEPRPA